MIRLAMCVRTVAGTGGAHGRDRRWSGAAGGAGGPLPGTAARGRRRSAAPGQGPARLGLADSVGGGDEPVAARAGAGAVAGGPAGPDRRPAPGGLLLQGAAGAVPGAAPPAAGGGRPRRGAERARSPERAAGAGALPLAPPG